MTNLIVIPARYASTRLPGKPLATLAGRTLIERAAAIGMAAASRLDDTELIVATDDNRIRAAVDAMSLRAVMTERTIASGTDRTLAAFQQLGERHRLIVNLQGDAVFASPDHIVRIVEAAAQTGADVTTPVARLDWPGLDAMREAKRASPASGTCCIADAGGRAIWFTKAIVPAMRDEGRLRAVGPLSPIRQHIGLYCYRPAALTKIAAAPPDPLEQIEGLEQLRFLAVGLEVRLVEVEVTRYPVGGIDSPDDLHRAEAVIAAKGDPYRDWRVTA